MQIKVDADDLVKTLRKLPSQLRRKAILPGLLKGGEYLRDQASNNVKQIANAGYSTGELEKSLTYFRMKNYKNYYRVGVSVARGAVNRKKLVNGRPVRIGLYAAVLEYGKDNQPPRSWIRKTARENPDAVLEITRKSISDNLSSSIEAAKK